MGPPLPEQVVEALGIAAMTKPLGKVSTNGLDKLAFERLALVNVTVSLEMPLTIMVDGSKALLRVGGVEDIRGITVKVATAGAVLLPLLVTKAPASNVLV